MQPRLMPCFAAITAIGLASPVTGVAGECDGPPEMWDWYKHGTFAKPDGRRNEMPLAWKLIRFKD